MYFMNGKKAIKMIKRKIIIVAVSISTFITCFRVISIKGFCSISPSNEGDNKQLIDRHCEAMKLISFNLALSPNERVVIVVTNSSI